MDIKNRFIKAYEDRNFRDLAAAPVHALQGVSQKDGEMLYKAFYIRTVADLANLKYARWAREICELADYAPDGDTASFKDKLDKKYEKKPPRILAKSPVDAIQGVSKKDAQLLKKAFNVKTVRDLAELKYIRWAQDVVDLAAPEAAADRPVDETRSPMRAISLLVLAVILVILAVIFWPHIRSYFAGTESRVADTKIPPYGDTIAEGRKAPAADEKASLPEVEAPDAGKIPPSPAGKKVTAPPARRCDNCYTVKWRDTFINVSERLSGDWRNWEKLYNLNRDVVKDTRLLIPGTQLRLPEGFRNEPAQ